MKILIFWPFALDGENFLEKVFRRKKYLRPQRNNSPSSQTKTEQKEEKKLTITKCSKLERIKGNACENFPVFDQSISGI